MNLLKSRFSSQTDFVPAPLKEEFFLTAYKISRHVAFHYHHLSVRYDCTCIKLKYLKKLSLACSVASVT